MAEPNGNAEDREPLLEANGASTAADLAPSSLEQSGEAVADDKMKKKKKKRERVTWAGVKDDQEDTARPNDRGPRVTSVNPVQGASMRQHPPPPHHPSHSSQQAHHHHHHHLLHHPFASRLPPPHLSAASSAASYQRYGSYAIAPSSLEDSTSTADGSTYDIDGRYSVGHPPQEPYVRVECYEDFSTTQSLEKCKNRVLNPYMKFLKLIGWRRFRAEHHDLQQPFSYQCCNVLYPVMMFLMLIYVAVIQKVTCFNRSEALYSTNCSRENSSSCSVCVECETHLVTIEVLQDLLILFTYLFGVYVFRFSESENLSTLMETVFLSYGAQHMQKSQTRLTAILQVFRLLGFVWVLLSFAVSVGRLFSLQLLGSRTYIQLLDPQYPLRPDDMQLYNGLRYFFVLSLLFGFMCFDLLYVAVVVNYVTQCQLIIFYVRSIIDKVRSKAYALSDGIKDIRHTYEFLQVLNGKLSAMTTICLYVFIYGLIRAYSSLHSVKDKEMVDRSEKAMAIIVGLCNIFLWVLIAVGPVIQASRLTSACRKLRRLGLEIAARPFVYADESPFVLDSFLLYSTSTRYTAKLVGIPVYPMFLFGLLFVLGLLVGLDIIDFRVLKWF